MITVAIAEAGLGGYDLHRQITELGHECMVVAPSLRPMGSGDHVKTDRRNAPTLARLHRASELSTVWMPGMAHEPMRDFD